MSSKRRPNLLFLLSDRHQAPIAGFMGDPLVRTQHLDAVASRGVVMDSALCAAPLCTPSRMSMMTGKEPHHCSAWSNHWVIFPEHVTWPAHFAQHGYRTALVGKMHFGGKDQLNGFQVRPYGDMRHGLGHQPEPIEMFPGYPQAGSAGPTQIPESLIQDVVVTRESLSFVLEHVNTQPDQPWFLCASYGRPHPPYTAPGRYIDRYRGRLKPLETPANFLDLLDPYTRRIAEREPDTFLDAQAALRCREAFYACIDFLDDCIGDLLRGLEEAGQLENTLILYTSDHGEMMGGHGLWGLKPYFDECVRVPLVVAGPGVAGGGQHLPHPISLMDLFPTTCGLAGLPAPEGLDGVDCSGLLADPNHAPAPRQWAPCAYYAYGVRVKGSPAASEHEPCNAMRLVRDAQWKYVEIEGGQPVLYNLVDDPGETTNLAGDPAHASRRNALRTALYRDFSWEQVHRQLAQDRQRLPQFYSGLKPTTPNQYRLADDRMFDAEHSLYEARWLVIPPGSNGGIIPQQFG